MKVGQRLLQPLQRKFLNKKIDEILEAGKTQIHPRDIKATVSTVLTRKNQEETGLTLDELKHMINNQCIVNRMELGKTYH